MPTRTATRTSRAGRIRRRPNGNANAGVPASARRATATPPRIRNGRAAAALGALCLLVLAALPGGACGSPAAVRRPGREADRRGSVSRASSKREQRRPRLLRGRPPAGRALDEWDDAVDDDEFNSDLEDEAAGLADDEFAYGDGGDGGGAEAAALAAPGPAPPGGYVMDDPAALEAEAAKHLADFAQGDDVLSNIVGVAEELEELEEGGGDDDGTIEREEELSSLEVDLIDEAIEEGKIDMEVVSEILDIEDQIDELEANANDDAATLEKEEELAGHEMDLIEGAIEEAVEEAIEEKAGQAAGEPGTAVPGDGDMPKTGPDAAEDGGKAADEPGMAVPGDGDIPIEAQAAAPGPAAPAGQAGDGTETAPEAAGETESLADQVADALEGYASPAAAGGGDGAGEETASEAETVSESPATAEGDAEEGADEETVSESPAAEAAAETAMAEGEDEPTTVTPPDGSDESNPIPNYWDAPADEEPMTVHMDFTPPDESPPDDGGDQEEYLVDETAIAEQIDAIPYGDLDDDSVDADGNLIDESEEVNEKIVEEIEEEIEEIQENLGDDDVSLVEAEERIEDLQAWEEQVEEEIQEEQSEQPDTTDELALATENTASELAEERVEAETGTESPTAETAEGEAEEGADGDGPMTVHMDFTPPDESPDDGGDQEEYVVDETAVAEQIDAIPYGDFDDDSVDADGNLIDDSEEVNEKIVEEIEEEIEEIEENVGDDDVSMIDAEARIEGLQEWEEQVEEEMLEEKSEQPDGEPLTEEAASELAEELGIATLDLTTMNPPDDIMVGNMTGPDMAEYEAAMSANGETVLGSSTVDAEEGIAEETAVANETAIHLKSDVDGVGTEEVSATAPTASTETEDILGGSTIDEATSAPLKMDGEEERPPAADPATTEAPGEGETELTTVLPAEGEEEIIEEPAEPPSGGQVTTTGATAAEEGSATTEPADVVTTTVATTTAAAATTAAPPPPQETIQTGAPTPRPTYQYVEPTSEEDDPLASPVPNGAFENGEEAPTDDDNYRGNADDYYRHEEEEVRKVGTGLTLGALVLMVYTAYQMSENPDGICASLCRLVITVIGCIIKIMLIPFKYVIGGGRPSGGHYMATPDYRDPYGSRHMELT